MGTHLRLTPILALIGALALGGASAARAQDTSAVRQDTSAVRSDTSGYQGYGADTLQRTAPTGADTGAKYNGPPTDTTLKAKPGVQTGPTDSSSMGQMGDSSSMGQMKDTSSSSR